MKKFFTRLSKVPKPPWNVTSPSASPSPVLDAKLVAADVPYARPHDHIALLLTTDGLLLRPHNPEVEHTESNVLIEWSQGSNPISVKEVHQDKSKVEDWSQSVVIYGVVGILELFSTSYLLVITARSKVGHLFEPAQMVYAVKAVTAVPLVEEGARNVLNVLISRDTALSRPSLLPPTPRRTAEGPSHGSDVAEAGSQVDPDNSEPGAATPPLRQVQFASEDEVKVLTPRTATFQSGRPASPSGSEMSVQSSEWSGAARTTPVAKAIASKLSFWPRLSKRASMLADADAEPAPFTSSSALAREPEALDDIIREGKQEPAMVLNSILAATAPPPGSVEERHTELETKIVRECIREYTKGGMYFAYNFDITRSLQHKQDQFAKLRTRQALLKKLDVLDEDEAMYSKFDVCAEANPNLPLWRRVDRHYWWNEWLSKPFIDAELHSYVLPIMQGHYQLSSFPIPREPVEFEEGDYAQVAYAVISRRSRDRAGLRYQRRGADDEAHVANFVETETIMRVEREGSDNVFGYVQIRGSIPLYWTQSSYGLKPPPQLSPERTHDQNLDVLRRHLEKNIAIYGPHCIVNLAEQQGKEAEITNAYRQYAEGLAHKNVQYTEYDFHRETRGMKYENIYNLIETLSRTFEQQGYLWTSNGLVLSRQKSVFRVNCIDCLDRTNVVQSAFARYMLDRQLGAVALLHTPEQGKTDADVVFNDMWANNGDAISRAYAGTSALKGDYTRTGRRDLTGLLNDGVNSLARMYSSTFSDWFSQAVIDFMLGNRTLSVFSEFLHKLQSTDPRDLIRLSKIRAEAIATSVARVLSEGERLLAGWTVFAPEELNVKVGDKFEEKVLLLAVQALYIVSYDYTLEKVKLYNRIPLSDITGISKGPYILSPLEAASRDALQNAGFIVKWRNRNQTTRVTSYSVRNSVEIPSPPASPRDSPSFRRTGPSSPLRNSSASKDQVAEKPPSLRSFSASMIRPPNLSALIPNSRHPRYRSMAPSRNEAGLSMLLSNGQLVPSGDVAFAAFKALPIDSTRQQRASEEGDRVVELSDQLYEAKNCKEAVDAIVESIRQACCDIGIGRGQLVTEDDVVSLAEAQRMTSMYAKMEYGVKKLLWLGG